MNSASCRTVRSPISLTPSSLRGQNQLAAAIPSPFFNRIGQKRSFDHLVGAVYEGFRDREAHHLCGPKIEDKLEFRRTFDWKIAWLLSPQNPVGQNQIGRASCRER